MGFTIILQPEQAAPLPLSCQVLVLSGGGAMVGSNPAGDFAGIHLGHGVIPKSIPLKSLHSDYAIVYTKTLS